MSDASKKRKKKFYRDHSNKKSKFSRVLCSGIKGFLCTTNGHPKFCIREAYNMLDEFCPQNDNCEKLVKMEKSSDSEDFESELKRDIEKLKSESEEKEFQVFDTGVMGCVFIKSSSTDPSEIMEKIITRIIETGKFHSRKILRMLPIHITCKAYLDDIKKAASPVFDMYFKGDAKTYNIVINRRNNSNILRNDLISGLAMIIKDRNPSHSVDLKKPQLTVLVEILKNICCLAVISDYQKFKKYNLIELGFAYQKSSPLDASDPAEDVSKDMKVKESIDSIKTENEVMDDVKIETLDTSNINPAQIVSKEDDGEDIKDKDEDNIKTENEVTDDVKTESPCEVNSKDLNNDGGKISDPKD